MVPCIHTDIDYITSVGARIAQSASEQAMDWSVRATIPGRVKSYSVFQNVQTGSKTHPSSSVGTSVPSWE